MDMEDKFNILVTGGAGFIGSNLVAGLLKDPRVNKIRILDNLSTGFQRNVDLFANEDRVDFFKGDIRDFETCLKACEGIDAITHQAALGSVPRSIKNPVASYESNVMGTINIFTAARDKNIKRVVFASSSSTYGDNMTLPKVEDKIGNALSPYAVTKLTGELSARVFGETYDLELIGLRYFNVFGPNQDPHGAYAAVIPLFVKALAENRSPNVNGDGTHSRDFTYVTNAVQANIRGLFTKNPEAVNQIYNIACGDRTTLNELIDHLKTIMGSTIVPNYGPERPGDIPHSLADITKAKTLLEYDPLVKIEEGLKIAVEWYLKSNILNVEQNS